MYVPSVSLAAVFAERLSVIRGDYHQGIFAKTPIVEFVDQYAQNAVYPANRVVIDVRVTRSKKCSVCIVDVLVNVHQMQVQEPAFARLRAQEFDCRTHGILVRSPHREGWFLAAHVCGDPTQSRAMVNVEALVEAKSRSDPSVAPQCEGVEASLTENFRRHQRPGRNGLGRPRHVGTDRVEPRPHGGHRTLHP